MQTTGDLGSLLAAKALTLVQQPVCNPSQLLLAASILQQSPNATWMQSLFSLVTDCCRGGVPWSLGLYDWGLKKLLQDCIDTPLGYIYFSSTNVCSYETKEVISLHHSKIKWQNVPGGMQLFSPFPRTNWSRMCFSTPLSMWIFQSLLSGRDIMTPCEVGNFQKCLNPEKPSLFSCFRASVSRSSAKENRFTPPFWHAS